MSAHDTTPLLETALFHESLAVDIHRRLKRPGLFLLSNRAQVLLKLTLAFVTSLPSGWPPREWTRLQIKPRVIFPQPTVRSGTPVVGCLTFANPMADALTEPAHIEGSLGSSVLGRDAPTTTGCGGTASPLMRVRAAFVFPPHPIVMSSRVLWYSRHVWPIEATTEFTCVVELNERELCLRTNSRGFHTSFGRFEVDDQLACSVIESLLKFVYGLG